MNHLMKKTRVKLHSNDVVRTYVNKEIVWFVDGKDISLVCFGFDYIHVLQMKLNISMSL